MRSKAAMIAGLSGVLCAQQSVPASDPLQTAKAAIHQQQFGEAEQDLQSYIALQPQSSDAMYLLSFVYFRENRPQDSLRAATRAAALREPMADDLKIVGLDYALLQDYVSAAKYLRLAVQRSPSNKEAMYHLGRVLYLQNQFDEAIVSFRRVLEIDAQDVKALTNLGLCYEGKNQSDAAVRAYRDAISVDQKSSLRSERPYYELGRLLSLRGEREQAAPLLLSAVEINPRCAECYVQLGKLQSDDGKLIEARQSLERAVALEEANVAAHYALARVYKRLGLADLASRELARTEALNSRTATAKPY